MDLAVALQGRRILIIEDDYLVAQVVAGLLEDAGAEIVGPIGRIDEALAFISENATPLDAAVLDVNLHGRKSYPIADAIAAQGIPVVFASGYGGEAIESAYRHYPRCEKPFKQATLVAALLGAIQEPAGRPLSQPASASSSLTSA